MEPYEPPVWSFGYQTQPSPWNSTEATLLPSF